MALLGAPSVAVAARTIVVAVKLVKLEVVAASKKFVVLVVAGILVVVLVSKSISSSNSSCCSSWECILSVNR